MSEEEKIKRDLDQAVKDFKKASEKATEEIRRKWIMAANKKLFIRG